MPEADHRPNHEHTENTLVDAQDRAALGILTSLLNESDAENMPLTFPNGPWKIEASLQIKLTKMPPFRKMAWGFPGSGKGGFDKTKLVSLWERQP